MQLGMVGLGRMSANLVRRLMRDGHEEGVPAPTLTSALSSRFGSRGPDHVADQRLSARRQGFDGHQEMRDAPDDAGTARA